MKKPIRFILVVVGKWGKKEKEHFQPQDNANSNDIWYGMEWILELHTHTHTTQKSDVVRKITAQY